MNQTTQSNMKEETKYGFGPVINAGTKRRFDNLSERISNLDLSHMLLWFETAIQKAENEEVRSVIRGIYNDVTNVLYILKRNHRYLQENISYMMDEDSLDYLHTVDDSCHAAITLIQYMTRKVNAYIQVMNLKVDSWCPTLNALKI